MKVIDPADEASEIGLKIGDTVILSDMSQWDAHNRIQLR